MIFEHHHPYHVVDFHSAGELHCPSYLMLGWRLHPFAIFIPHISVLFLYLEFEW